jgi:CheY-like chemotaxis protein
MSNPESTKVPRILVVDDMPDNLFLMNGLFEDRYDVVQASCGKDGLAVVMSDNPPDMVLLDIMMPDMDGYEVLRRIRTHPPTANIPVIFLTALASHQDTRLGLDLGAVDYLTKPVDPEHVIRRVDAHVQATARARRIEALSEKLARHLAPEEWQQLFHGSGVESVRFEQRQQAVLHAEPAGAVPWTDSEANAFAAEVEWLAIRHNGVVDRFTDGGAAIVFDDVAACARMAGDLQAGACGPRLRMGLHVGVCDTATFRRGFQTVSTLVGTEGWTAARTAASSPAGRVAVSPETLALVQGDVHVDASGCLRVDQAQGDAANAAPGAVSFAGLSLH